MSQPVHITVAPNVYVDAESVRAAVQAALVPQLADRIEDSGNREWSCRYRGIDTVTVSRNHTDITVLVDADDTPDKHIYLTPERAREMAGALLALARAAEAES